MTQSSNIASPTLDEWSRLYAAAQTFSELAPWEWMYDSDLFGVKNPEDGEVGYCCVLGNLGECLGLTLYRGSEGLACYRKTLVDSLEEVIPGDILFSMSAILYSLSDREYLEKDDMKVIRQLKLKFRGKNAWPSFRSYSPGYVPWPLNATEARFLTVVLEQATVMGKRMQADPDLLDSGPEDAYLVRVLEGEGAAVEWSDAWIKPEPYEPVRLAPAGIDMSRVAKVEKSIKHRRGVWEFHFALENMPIGNAEQRPRYPLVSLIASHDSGMVLGHNIAVGEENLDTLAEGLLKIIGNTGVCPSEICVKTDQAYDLLHLYSKALGFELRKTASLPREEEAREGLRGMLMGE